MTWTIEEKQRLAAEHITSAMCPYLDQRVIAIIEQKNGISQSIGSGTGIIIEDKYFIATAGHVLHSWETSGLDLVLIGEGEPSVEVTTLLDYNYLGPEPPDIAWLEISVEDAQRMEKIFLPVSQISNGIPHLSDDPIMVSGYPRDLIRPVQLPSRRGLVLRPICCQTITIEPSHWTIQGDSNADIMIKYPEEGFVIHSDEINTPPNPPGISGGGIWALNVNCDGVWSPDRARLIGIEHRWSKTWRYLRATQIQHWIQLLWEDIPQLRDTLEIHLREART